MREVAHVRVHGTTVEPTIDCFERDERETFAPLAAKTPFLQVHEVCRRVQPAVEAHRRDRYQSGSVATSAAVSGSSAVLDEGVSTPKRSGRGIGGSCELG